MVRSFIDRKLHSGICKSKKYAALDSQFVRYGNACEAAPLSPFTLIDFNIDTNDVIHK
jgi:hypothetical protein